MSSRRDFLKAALAAAACGPAAGVDDMGFLPSRVFPGPHPLDPRQPKQFRPIPGDPFEKFNKKVYNNQSPASPIHLSSSLVLRSGGTGTVPAAAMKNPMGQDMEILEIKFEISGAFSGAASVAFGGTIWCDLTMGGVKLTNGAIPVWNLGRAENLTAEIKLDDAGLFDFASYSWRLPRPLFVPAGAVVVPKFVHVGFVPAALNVRVGYSARTVTTKPKRFYVPWAAKYVSKSFNPLTAADVDLSSELDLVNPHPEVLHLQRMTGRTLYIDAAAVTSENLPESFGSQYLVMRMTDSYGRPIVRSYTPFRLVFGALTRSWEMDNGAQLDPEAYYVVNLRKDAMTMATAGAAAQAFVSIIGWREMEKF